MSAEAFNEVIHAPIRLRICGMLRTVDSLEFATLRDTLGVSDAVLSKHLKVLVDAGFVTIVKIASPGRDDARRLTWIRLEPAGRKAFDAHIAAIRAIAGEIG